MSCDHCEMKRDEIDELQDTINDLRKQRDEWKEMAQLRYKILNILIHRAGGLMTVDDAELVAFPPGVTMTERRDPTGVYVLHTSL